ncbi:MAG TPA: NADH-dependent [FeFe] hydrogenase, group A6 [Armatimonadota bacterium]|jgi:iron-only hydrogenase group A
MENITLTIDGIQVSVPKGSTVLEAAKSAGIGIPTLCYLKGVQAIGACRICLVEVQGGRGLQASCVYPATNGMIVKTNTARVRAARKAVVELMLSAHRQDCTVCGRNLSCELQAVAKQLGVQESRFEGVKPKQITDTSSPSIVRDTSKCILCRRCVTVCQQVQGVGAISTVERGFQTAVLPALKRKLSDVPCVMCGQCVSACPVGALQEKDSTAEVWRNIADPGKHVVVQTAPAVRAAIGEEFGMTPGTRATGKMVTALRMLGFDKVFDTDFTADLTIIEEGNELLQRLQSGGTLPMITSCSPGWIKYIEHFYPALLPHLSTCKSPQQMFGALAKTYYAEKMGIKPEDIYVVSIMPCTAKKYECERPEMSSIPDSPDVDAVLTTREAARMIREMGLDFVNLPDGKFDEPLGISTGAAVIFGATGGVMEAALRTVYEVVTGQTLKNIDLTEVRGLQGVKEASIKVGDIDVKVAVASGLANARKLMDKVNSGEADYHFIEIMCCPGGCLGGGGQPIPTTDEIRAARMTAIYEEDANLPLRKSHENPAVKALYAEFLEKPLGHKSHELLHTHYTPRTKHPEAIKEDE